MTSLDCNVGYKNSGFYNKGNNNSGSWNSGNRNSGSCNSGSWNSGNWNLGDLNSDSCNKGNCNTGKYNSGDRNSGSWNSGNWNSGDWNTADGCNGCFNTVNNQTIYLFNKPSSWTREDWMNSEAKCILNQIPSNTVSWVISECMTDAEKVVHPEYETIGGYLKEVKSDDVQKWWDSLGFHEKEVIKSIPNFDAEIFKECTGIAVS